jgi:hypothetical protein
MTWNGRLAAPLVLFGLVGAALQQSTGTWNLADVLRDLGSPTIAYLFVAIGFSGSVMSNLYSGALSLSDVAPRIGYRIGLCLVAVVGTALAALHFSRWMLPYLTTMALAGPPLAAICWIHVWGRRSPRGNLNWRAAGIASWAAGLAVGLGLNAAGVGVALPAGILAAAGVYLAATWLGYSPVNLGARRSAKAESPSTRSEEPFDTFDRLARGDGVDRRPRSRDRDRGQLRHRERHLGRALPQPVGGNDLVDEADAKRLLGPHHPRGQEQLLCVSGPDERDEPAQAAGEVNHSEPTGRHRKPGRR